MFSESSVSLTKSSCSGTTTSNIAPCKPFSQWFTIISHFTHAIIQEILQNQTKNGIRYLQYFDSRKKYCEIINEIIPNFEFQNEIRDYNFWNYWSTPQHNKGCMPACEGKRFAFASRKQIVLLRWKKLLSLIIFETNRIKITDINPEKPIYSPNTNWTFWNKHTGYSCLVPSTEITSTGSTLKRIFKIPIQISVEVYIFAQNFVSTTESITKMKSLMM